MMMKKLFASLCLVAVMALSLTACKKTPKEADVKASVEQAAGSAVSVDVDGSTVTLTGTVADEAAKSAAESAAKSVEGVENVTNNITVSAPPAPMPNAQDQTMQGSVNAVVAKYPGVSATVMNGVVTLTGTLAKDKVRDLMMEINDLKPTRVDNQITSN